VQPHVCRRVFRGGLGLSWRRPSSTWAPARGWFTISFSRRPQVAAHVALEIERRFLVVGDGWRHHSVWVRSLRQGYLVAAAEGLTLRVRTSEPLGAAGTMQSFGIRGRAEPASEAFLTLKAPPSAGSSGLALCRLEFEYPIPLADGEELLGLAEASLRKRRHGLDLSGGDWVLDVFEDDNAPLVLAEVELASADQAVVIPSWCAREVTGRRDLSNAALAQRPFTHWSEAEQRELLHR
jgi:adenylate cyclase